MFWRLSHGFTALGGAALLAKAYTLDNRLSIIPNSVFGTIATLFLFAFLVCSFINAACYGILGYKRFNLHLSTLAFVSLGLMIIFITLYSAFVYVPKELSPNERAASRILLLVMFIWGLSQIAIPTHSVEQNLNQR